MLSATSHQSAAFSAARRLGASGRSGWTAGELQLTALLSFSDQARIRHRLAEIYGLLPRPQGPALRALLQPLVVELSQAAVAAEAPDYGVGVAELLAFADPASRQFQLEGTRCVARRLDRVWGGPPLLLIEALQETRLRWPGPGLGRWVALRGRVRADEAIGEENAVLQIPAGSALTLAAGAWVATRHSATATLMEDSRAAGFEVPRLAAAILGDSMATATALGRLTVSTESRLARLNGRQARLSSAETRVLELLARQPGTPVTRAVLARELGLRQPRAVDRVMVALRNKLGDGLISTLYGVGYVLETESGV